MRDCARFMVFRHDFIDIALVFERLLCAGRVRKVNLDPGWPVEPGVDHPFFGFFIGHLDWFPVVRVEWGS